MKPSRDPGVADACQQTDGYWRPVIRYAEPSPLLPQIEKPIACRQKTREAAIAEAQKIIDLRKAKL